MPSSPLIPNPWVPPQTCTRCASGRVSSARVTGFSKERRPLPTTASPRRARLSRRTRRCAAKSDVRRWEARSALRRRSSSTDWSRRCRAFPLSPASRRSGGRSWYSSRASRRRPSARRASRPWPGVPARGRPPPSALRRRGRRRLEDREGPPLLAVSRRSKAQPSAWNSSVESQVFVWMEPERSLFVSLLDGGVVRRCFERPKQA